MLIPLGLVVFLPGQIILESVISMTLLLICETNQKTSSWFTMDTPDTSYNKNTKCFTQNVLDAIILEQGT